jgi:hypothetical protein
VDLVAHSRVAEAELLWEQTQDTGKVKPRVYLGRKNANWKATMNSSGGGGPPKQPISEAAPIAVSLCQIEWKTSSIDLVSIEDIWRRPWTNGNSIPGHYRFDGSHLGSLLSAKASSPILAFSPLYNALEYLSCVTLFACSTLACCHASLSPDLVTITASGE